MSTDQTTKKPTKEEIRAALTEAVATDPALVRTIVEELAANAQAQKAAEKKSAKASYDAERLEQKIMVTSAEEAEKIALFLDQHEGDAMMRTKEGGWLYVRRRALLKAVEPDKGEKDKVSEDGSGKPNGIVGSDGAPITSGDGRKDNPEDDGGNDGDA